MKGIFVSGTDTDIGKTLVASLLTHHLSKFGKVTYFKPLQAGQPTDFDQVRDMVSPEVSIASPSYNLKRPMSPNRAADLEGVSIAIEKVRDDFKKIQSSFTVVEGAGGLLVPINSEEKVIDVAQHLALPVVLVSSTRLGTINHTLLSIEALKSRGIEVLGIVLSGEEDPGLAQTLEEQSGVSVLFHVPLLEEVSPDVIQSYSADDFNGCIDWLAGSKLEKNNGSIDSLSKKDKEFVWHPFTQHGIVSNHPVVSKGSGSYLWYDDKKVIDAISSWWVNLFGHCNPELSQAVAHQSHQLEHVIFAGFTHRPAIELSEQLIQMAKGAGAPLDKVFFSDNGSTSVEVALKMTFQYFQQKGEGKRRKFLALKGSYHGDTIGAMSLGERKGFNEIFDPLLFDVVFVDPFSVEDLKNKFAEFNEQIAGVIVEPMVQGASGMRMYGADFLNQLAQLSRENGNLVICDEVFTGFYRTGKLFAFEHSELKPDLLCLSKGLTGGYLPLSATLVRQELYDHFKGETMRTAFLHGHSYTANPIACQVALQTTKMLQRPETLDAIRSIEEKTSKALDRLRENSKIFNIRQLGTIGAMEIGDENANYFKGDASYRFNQKAISKGVLLRPLGGTVYAVPPYCISDSEIEKVYEVIDQITREEF